MGVWWEDGRLGGIDISVWGKWDAWTGTRYALLFHMIDVGAVAGELWDGFLTASQRAVICSGLGLTPEQARGVVAFPAALHDIGKLTPCFQQRVPGAWQWVSEELRNDQGQPAQVGHARASMHAALGLLADLGFTQGGNDSPVVRAAQCVGGHHGRFLQLDVDQGAGAARVAAVLGGTSWQQLRRRYARLLWHQFSPGQAPQQISVPAAVLITGLIQVADRVASRKAYWFPHANAPAFGAHEHLTRACQQAAEAVQECGLNRTPLPPVPFARAHGVPAPNAAQAAILEQMPQAAAERGTGIVAIADATGTGKSVNALELARIFSERCGTSGVAWLLPSTAAADSLHERLQAYVHAHSPRLGPVTVVHSHRYLTAAYPDRHLTPSDTPAPSGTEPAPDTAPPRPPADLAGLLGDEDLDWFDWDEDDTGGEPEEDGEPAAGPDVMLRGWGSELLAQFTVATVDQAQMAVLPVRHSPLRLLALSGKTVIVDEAHALEPFSQLQLRRLLSWLAALGCPVVLLSATLPASTCHDLVRSYLTGAGHRPAALARRELAPAYPGWMFADAATARTLHMDEHARAAHRRAQHRTVRFAVRDVTHRPLDQPDRTPGVGERLTAVADALHPVATEGGCAAVVCATVADAQDTYTFLQHHMGWDDTELLLLHARRGDGLRERQLRLLRDLLGPAGQRPKRLVVVTTSLLDTSLDIDVDLMVSDIASIARLLQRAGRLARFAHRPHLHRPAWWHQQDAAQLTVLHPVNSRGATALPPGWHRLEPAAVLHATARLLTRPGAPQHVDLPGHVQDLVEAVHGDTSPFAQETARLQQMAARHHTRTRAEEHHSAAHLVPPWQRVSSLADLHRQQLTSAWATTRLGTMPRRLLPCYRTPHGHLTLDAEGRIPLPDKPHLTAKQVRALLEHSMPVPAAWVAHPAHSTPATPASWQRHPLLAGTVLLPAENNQPGVDHRFGHYRLRMDAELGLVHHRDQH